MRAILIGDRSARTVKRFLRSGKLGDLGHLSCIVRRAEATGGRGPDERALAVWCAGGAHLAEVAALLDSSPVTVMGRIGAPDSHELAGELFVELRNDLHVHYFGARGSDRSHATVWLEGTKGSLRTDGRSVWWRKRGWRFFAPVSAGFGGPADEGPEIARIAGLVGRADEASPHADTAVALAAAAMESARRHEPVRIAQGARP